MLPNFHYQCYVEFKQALEQLQQTACCDELDVSKLRQSYQKTQQLFQQQILSLDASDLDSVDEARVRSYHTEISKQLRLLSMDVIFLQAARQPGTFTDRQNQILQRIQTLIGYCDRILQLNSRS